MDESKLIDVINFLPIPIAIAFDNQCQNVKVNKAMADVMAIFYQKDIAPSASFISSPFFRAYHLCQQLTESDLPLRQAVLGGKKVTNYEIDLIRPDGSVATIIATAAPWYDGKNIIGGIAAYLDVGALRQAESEIKSLRNQLQQLSSTIESGLQSA
ncbi:MAG TPA: hypothetical protein VLE72_03895 [Candidatus Saccharimonadales bacterium]|nr:hypothetical protein [Candidatus Saccharimonadales bacterium]